MSEVTISKERINYTIDLLITMVTEEIAEETGRDRKEVLMDFLCSRTGKAFENEKAKRGLSIIEVLSTCPTNWGMSPTESMQFVKDKMIPYYPLGVYKDVTAEEGAKA